MTCGPPEPFVLDVPESQLEDLRDRLRRVRLPEPATDPSQGIGLELVTELCRHRSTDDDWRRVEAELNAAGRWRTEIGGLGIRFLHARSPRPDARPLIISHGWPGPAVESLDVITALTDPGDESRPAFHRVVPSLPGYGVSDKPTQPGWGTARIADAWVELMSRPGYDHFLAQGGDRGAMITSRLGAQHPDRVDALRTTVPVARRPEGFDDATPTENEQCRLAYLRDVERYGSGYSGRQRTRPQTPGHGLVDSPRPSSPGSPRSPVLDRRPAARRSRVRLRPRVPRPVPRQRLDPLAHGVGCVVGAAVRGELRLR